MDWVLVTGASEGLGREFADLAATEKRPVILSARQVAKLETLAAELRSKHGVEVVVIPADLSQPGEAERLWAEATASRRIDTLVNNACLGWNGPFAEMEGWASERQSIEVNVMAATALMKLAVADMVKVGKGRILNVASLAGFVPGPNMAVYHATKAYFLSLSEAVAQELSGTGITVTALCPGVIKTSSFGADEADRATILTRLLPMSTARQVAEAGWHGMGRGKGIVVPGLMGKILAQTPRITPRKLAAGLTGFLLKRR